MKITQKLLNKNLPNSSPVTILDNKDLIAITQELTKSDIIGPAIIENIVL